MMYRGVKRQARSAAEKPFSCSVPRHSLIQKEIQVRMGQLRGKAKDSLSWAMTHCCKVVRSGAYVGNSILQQPLRPLLPPLLCRSTTSEETQKQKQLHLIIRVHPFQQCQQQNPCRQKARADIFSFFFTQQKALACVSERDAFLLTAKNWMWLDSYRPAETFGLISNQPSLLQNPYKGSLAVLQSGPRHT